MPFNRPNLKEIIERVGSDVASRTSDKNYPAPGSVADVFAHALGGASHLLHAHLDWGVKQMLPSTATGEHLELHASIWLPEGRKPAAAATGTVVFRGSDGLIVPSGSLLSRDDGAVFVLTDDAVIRGGRAEAAVRAQDAGDAGNTAPDARLVMTAPVLGVESVAQAGSVGITGGSDLESDESLRARIIARIQNPAHGGADADYVNWALEVPGITRAWVLPLKNGLGTVTVVVLRDDDDNPIPDENELQKVADHLDARRPVTARVFVVAPKAKPVHYRINISPDTQLIRAAAEAALKEFHRREAKLGGSIHLSRVSEALSDVPSEFMHHIISPTADVVAAENEILTFGGVEWGV